MIKNWNSKEFKIGVLGGGQLGRMLIQEAINLNLHIHIMDPDKNAPCSSIAQTFTCAPLTDYDAVVEFGKDKSLITVEIENVNIEALEELENRGIQVYPQPRVLKIIKDKLVNNLPTAPLYDTPLFTQHLESAYLTMYDRYQQGLDPEHIYVKH